MALTFPRVLQQLAPAGGPLAGRQKEMDALRRAWADAVAGAGGVVLLAGQAGVGKTRLAAMLAAEVDEAGGSVLVGACPAHGADPYQPLVDALGPLPAGERDRSSMLETMAAGVAARAQRTPVLLVLDDLHRADRSTLLGVRRLVDVAEDASMLIVATYRDGSLDRSHPLTELLAGILPRSAVERLHVDGLPLDAVAEMVGELALGKRLWRQSGGNPVWVAELLRPGALDGTVPADFDDLVARRVARLSSPARAFLQAAAVAGSEFVVDVAVTAARISSGRGDVALKQVVAAGFIVEEPVAPGRGRRFVHEMVRDAVEDGLTPAARVDLHHRVGRALEAQTRGAGALAPSALLAWHFRAATPVGVSGRVLHHAAVAGDLAMKLLAWDEAADHYGTALAAATGASSAVRADLLLGLGEAQRLAGEGARARQAFFEAAGLARARGDGARLARAALALGQLDAVWGADPELEAVARDASALLGQVSVPAPTLPSAADFASGTLYDMLDGPRPEAAPAPAPAAPAEERAEAVALLRARHVALAGPEHSIERLDAAQQLVTVAEAAGDVELVATGQGWRFVDALRLGRHHHADAALEAHAVAARKLASPGLQADAAAWVAMRAMAEGRPEVAGVAAADAFDLAVEAGTEYRILADADDAFLVQRWWLALEWGTAGDLAEVVEECRLAAASAMSADARMWRASIALALARDGRLELAAEELRRVTDHGLGELLRDPDRLHPLTCLVEVAWMVGDTYRATMMGEIIEPFAGHVVVAGRGLVCRGSVAWACGMAAASAKRWDDAERHFRTAMAVHRDMGASALLARTRFDWSTVLAERNRMTDRRRAAEHRRRASELAAGAGMTRLLAEIARRAS